MSRYRWFQVEWPVSIRTISGRIKARAFDENSTHGFVVDRVRDDYLDARYVERIEYTDTITDPFGKELSYPRVEFRQCIFRASLQSPGLELIDAPRSAQGLLNRLSEVTDFEVAINGLNVDVLAWADAFQKALGISPLVDSLQIGALEIEPGITAKAVIKGDRDVREACSVLTNDRKYAMEKVQLRLLSPSRGTVVLTNTGSAKIDADDPTDALRNALRQSIMEVTNKT